MFMLATVVSSALAACAFINWWPAAFWASAASTIAFFVIDLVIAFRARWRAKAREMAIIADADPDDLYPDELWPVPRSPGDTQYLIPGRDFYLGPRQQGPALAPVGTIDPTGIIRTQVTYRPWWRRLWRRLTPWWAIALAPLLIVPIGLRSAPPASADTTSEAAFIDAVTDLAVPYGTRDAMLNVGRVICQQFDLGMDLDTAEQAAVLGGYTPDQAAAVTHASIGTLCPWHAELLVDGRTVLR
jgi:hypothetical protein